MRVNLEWLKAGSCDIHLTLDGLNTAPVSRKVLKEWKDIVHIGNTWYWILVVYVISVGGGEREVVERLILVPGALRFLVQNSARVFYHRYVENLFTRTHNTCIYTGIYPCRTSTLQVVLWNIVHFESMILGPLWDLSSWPMVQDAFGPQWHKQLHQKRLSRDRVSI